MTASGASLPALGGSSAETCAFALSSVFGLKLFMCVTKFWQQHDHAIELATNEMIDQPLDYIHRNPVEAGIVLSPEHYLCSSAINDAQLPEKLIEVILI